MKTPRRLRAPKISETQVHLQFVAYLKKIGLGGNAVAFHVRNERPGEWQRLNAHRMGIWSGLPDWIVIDGGHMGGIEIKPLGWREKKLINKTSNLTQHELRQLDAHNSLRRAGAWVIICETLEEILEALREHGVPLRETDIITESFRKHLTALTTDAETKTA